MRVESFQQHKTSDVKAFARKLYILFGEPPLKWSFVCFANHYMELRKLELSEVASRSFLSGWMEAPPAWIFTLHMCYCPKESI